MKFELQPFHRNVSEEDIISDLKKIAKNLEKNSVTQKEYSLYGKYSHSTVYKKFQSWHNALNAAGLALQSNIGSGISAEELFRNLEDVWIKLARQPNYKDMVMPLSKYHASTYERRFGGWRKALEKFVEYVNSDELQKTKSLPAQSSFKQRTQRTPDLRLRFRIMQRDKFKCVKCGNSPSHNQKIILEVDHITPWSKGGETILENLQTLCNKCNQGKSNLFST
jgi:hypothetical protein